MTASRPALTPERLRVVRDIFDRALEADPELRGEVLHRACDGDSDLLAEVMSLIRAHDQASDDWERPAAAQLAGAALDDPDGWMAEPLKVGARLGAYVVTRKIGEGGMGAVYEAQRADASYVGRVAIKTLGRGLANPALARRFIRERQILARLHHAHIATLLDGGATDRGVPYLVMEYVEGEPLDQHCAARRLTIADRLDLYRQVCGAIQFAHRNLVVHRDLKPSNIMVTGDGVVKLLDFGIAKLVAAEGDAEDGATRDGMVPLTSAFASPEQARGDDITTATDVYSAGVVLYQLLAGVAPYDTDGMTPSAVRAVLSEQTPPLPSAVATDAHAVTCGMTDARELRRRLAGELDAIVMMALRKEPERRYASAEAMSEDIHRHLKGLQVVARPDTLGYRLSSFVRRRRALVVGAAVGAAALVLGTAVAVRQAQVARAEARRATRITEYLRAIVGAADPAHYSTVRTGRIDVGLLEVLDSTRSRVVQDLVEEPRIRADLYWSMANAYRAFGRHDLALLLQDSARALHMGTVGDRSIDVARDVHFMGVTLQDMGRYDEAAARFREAHERYLALRAPPDSEVTDVETSLGQLLGVGLNQVAEGEQLLRSAERRVLAERTPRHAMAGLVQGALATTLMNRGGYAAADSAFARAVASYGHDSLRARSERAIALVNWGMLKSRQGRYAEAVRLKRQALDDVRATLGSAHVNVVRLQQRLADDLVQLGQLREAAALADSGLATLARLSTPHPVEWTQMLRVRGAVATREGRLDVAQAVLDSADLHLAQLSGGGRVGPEIALLGEHGRLREAQGRIAEARSSFERAYDVARQALGAGNAIAQGALSRLAAFARRSGDSTRADALLADSARAAVTGPR